LDGKSILLGSFVFAHVNERHLCLLVCDTLWNMLVVFIWPHVFLFLFLSLSLSLSSLFITREVMALLGIIMCLLVGSREWQNMVKSPLWQLNCQVIPHFMFQSISNGNMKIACTMKWVSTIAWKWVELLNFALLIFVGVKCKFA